MQAGERSTADSANTLLCKAFWLELEGVKVGGGGLGNATSVVISRISPASEEQHVWCTSQKVPPVPSRLSDNTVLNIISFPSCHPKLL